MPRGLLVGSHFRPPAKIILSHLASGARLRLESEADNPYDEHAVRVYISPEEIPASEHEALRAELPASGFDLGEILAEGEDIWLGYLAATGGRPLQKAQKFDASLVGNRELQNAWAGRLLFGASGEALVEVEEGEETTV